MFSHKKPKAINPDDVDPSVYYYDEVYDNMKNDEQHSRTEQGSSSVTADKRPKYTQGLLDSANERKSEKELRKFKKYARDREDAREDIEDEDIYVTSAYKKKLEEFTKLEKERQEKLEREKDRALNFDRKSRTDDKKSRMLPEVPSEHTHDRMVSSSDIKDTKTEEKDEIEPFIRRRPPKTIEERRRFLEEVLAKRTVGEKYDQAVQRYLMRKLERQSGL